MAWFTEEEVRELDAAEEVKNHSLEALKKFR